MKVKVVHDDVGVKALDEKTLEVNVRKPNTLFLRVNSFLYLLSS